MNRTIEFYRKNVFGKEKIYVKDKFMRAALTKLTGKQTLDGQDMSTLKWMGFTFVEVLAP